MKVKIFASFLLAVFLLAGIVAATIGIGFTPAQKIDFSISENLKSLTITNTGDEPMKITSPFNDITISNNGNAAKFKFTLIDGNISNITAGNPVIFNVSLEEVTGAIKDFKFGPHTGTLPVDAKALSGNLTTSGSVALNFNRGFCDLGERATNNISIGTMDVNNKGDSADSEDDVWILTDKIEVDVDVDNLMQRDDLEDIIVELGLYDSQGRNFADDLDFSNKGDEEIDLGKIKDGKDENAMFVFRVPADFDIGSYRLVLKAYEDGKENLLCVETETMDIRVDEESEEDRFVIVDEINFDSTQATCGETISGSFKVFNIGDEDQDRVKITMKNEVLGVDSEFEITNLDRGDEDTVSFSFPVPQGIENKDYRLDFRTYYEYDDGFYDRISEDTFRSGPLSVIGCSLIGSTGGEILISAILSSDAKAGENLVVTATIVNTGIEAKTITLQSQAYQSWAELVSVSPTVLNLGSGESGTSTITLNVKKTASGSQSFVIEANADGKTTVQEVGVNIQEEAGGFSLGLLEGDSGIIWIIAIVNLVLIILIIFVAVRLSRR